MSRLKKILLLLAVTACAVLAAGCSVDPGKRHLEAGFTAEATFRFTGGVLTTSSTEVTESIKYAYKPDSLIVDPATIAGYSLWRDGYDFAGWYRDPEYTDAWDFKSDRIGGEPVTLYAKWDKSIRYTYTLCYTDGDETVELYAYPVSAGDKFDDRLDKASSRAGHTPLGFYADETLQTDWPADFVHPGGETDTDVRVYVRYIEGVWSLVDDFRGLQRAISDGKNVYLTGHVDGGGAELTVFRQYAGVFEGNGYTVSDLTRTSTAGSLYGKLSLFGDLGENAEIRNVRFENIRFSTAAKATYRELKVAALALTAANSCKIADVHISGTFVLDPDTRFSGGAEPDLSRLNEAFYETSVASIENFTSSIVIEQ